MASDATAVEDRGAMVLVVGEDVELGWALRGRADRLLSALATEEQARGLIDAHGPPWLRPHARPIADAVGRARPESVVVVRALVGRPTGSTGHPVGGWHYVPTAIYADDERLTPLFEAAQPGRVRAGADEPSDVGRRADRGATG